MRLMRLQYHLDDLLTKTERKELSALWDLVEQAYRSLSLTIPLWCRADDPLITTYCSDNERDEINQYLASTRALRAQLFAQFGDKLGKRIIELNLRKLALGGKWDELIESDYTISESTNSRDQKV